MKSLNDSIEVANIIMHAPAIDITGTNQTSPVKNDKSICAMNISAKLIIKHKNMNVNKNTSVFSSTFTSGIKESP